MKPTQQPAEAAASLSQLREQICQLDQQLLMLLSQRQQLVLQIRHCKQQLQLPSYDPQREQQLLQMLTEVGQQQQLPASYIKQLYQVIFRHSLALQEIT